jgi:hypothetical protein
VILQLCLDLKVVVKPTHKTVGHILNGRAAEVAGCEDVSSSDEDDDAIHPRFARPDNMKLLLESMFRGYVCVYDLVRVWHTVIQFHLTVPDVYYVGC